MSHVTLVTSSSGLRLVSAPLNPVPWHGPSTPFLLYGAHHTPYIIHTFRTVPYTPSDIHTNIQLTRYIHIKFHLYTRFRTRVYNSEPYSTTCIDPLHHRCLSCGAVRVRRGEHCNTLILHHYGRDSVQEILSNIHAWMPLSSFTCTRPSFTCENRAHLFLHSVNLHSPNLQPATARPHCIGHPI